LSVPAIDTAPVAVFGGTFDPIHNGHLRSALELAERLGVAEVRMMPCARPAHRDTPAGSAEHRAAMLEVAVANEPLLLCDRSELRREGPSYTIDSLIALRRELGPERCICLIMGCDAVLDVTSWHRWEELLDWANVVVIARPGWSFPQRDTVAHWLQENACRDIAQLQESPAGAVLVEELRPLPISSSEIRQLIAAGRSARFLLPEPVLDYICKHKLYG
jgi:nicotinate-nucleotide adenylyltransferase